MGADCDKASSVRSSLSRRNLRLLQQVRQSRPKELGSGEIVSRFALKKKIYERLDDLETEKLKQLDKTMNGQITQQQNEADALPVNEEPEASQLNAGEFVTCEEDTLKSLRDQLEEERA